jgi:hypothetical protein
MDLGRNLSGLVRLPQRIDRQDGPSSAQGRMLRLRGMLYMQSYSPHRVLPPSFTLYDVNEQSNSDSLHFERVRIRATALTTPDPLSPSCFLQSLRQRIAADESRLYNHVRTVAYWLDAAPVLADLGLPFKVSFAQSSPVDKAYRGQT